MKKEYLPTGGTHSASPADIAMDRIFKNTLNNKQPKKAGSTHRINLVKNNRIHYLNNILDENFDASKLFIRSNNHYMLITKKENNTMKNKQRVELGNKLTYEEIVAEYNKNRYIFIQGQKEQDASFDYHILAFSAGSFGISFAFIDKVVPLKSSIYNGILIAAWICFALILLLELISFRVSSWTYLKLEEDANKVVETRIKGNDATYSENIVGKLITRLLNGIVLLVFSGGIICLILFVIINICK